MKICNYCGCELNDSVVKCNNCQGTDFSTRCNNCGGIFKNAAFCPSCGTRAGDTGKTCPRCSTIYFSPACPNCGYSPQNERYEEQLCKQNKPQSVIVNSLPVGYGYSSTAGKACNKYVSLLLCIFLGYLGAHKFYEGKAGMGLVYVCTLGLFGLGWIFDIAILLFKPNPYYV